MNGTEIRQLNAEDAAEYQAVFLGALQSAPTAFAADYGEESARSSDQIAERFRREVIFGAFVDGRLCDCHRARPVLTHRKRLPPVPRGRRR